MCKFRLLTVCCCLLALLPSMALAPIENTNNKDTRDIFFHLIIEIDCEEEIPNSLLEFYTPSTSTENQSSNWLDQRGKRIVNDIVIDNYPEEEMAKNISSKNKPNSKS